MGPPCQHPPGRLLLLPHPLYPLRKRLRHELAGVAGLRDGWKEAHAVLRYHNDRSN